MLIPYNKIKAVLISREDAIEFINDVLMHTPSTDLREANRAAEEGWFMLNGALVIWPVGKGFTNTAKFKLRQLAAEMEGVKVFLEETVEIDSSQYSLINRE
jgi:hypothetical protein